MYLTSIEQHSLFIIQLARRYNGVNYNIHCAYLKLIRKFDNFPYWLSYGHFIIFTAHIRVHPHTHTARQIDIFWRTFVLWCAGKKSPEIIISDVTWYPSVKILKCSCDKANYCMSQYVDRWLSDEIYSKKYIFTTLYADRVFRCFSVFNDELWCYAYRDTFTSTSTRYNIYLERRSI